MPQLMQRPTNFELEECFICGKEPAAVWVYPEPGHPKSQLFPHRFITGRCHGCHEPWIQNWADMGAAPGLVIMRDLKEARAMDLIFEVMTA